MFLEESRGPFGTSNLTGVFAFEGDFYTFVFNVERF